MDSCRQTLGEQDKNNSQWQQDLSFCYEKMGEVSEASGKLQEAVEDYREDISALYADCWGQEWPERAWSETDEFGRFFHLDPLARAWQ